MKVTLVTVALLALVAIAWGQEPECGPNMVFSKCGALCEPKCSYKRPAGFCKLQCRAKCVCISGYILDDHERCVPIESC
ncbi:hypothetical protein Zmor_018785 [Zophobas morio]|uniref:TIL domain-containing protein n=1 Tax=Zophobas morio TaxID=2755281 RepID=A0AA38IC01_9CUCU|nr:hypothetical protein Zmor_018785 [Zophobas morio]